MSIDSQSTYASENGDRTAGADPASIRAHVAELLREADAREAGRPAARADARATRAADREVRSLAEQALRELGVDPGRSAALVAARNERLSAAADAADRAAAAEAVAVGDRLSALAAEELKGLTAVAGVLTPFIPESVILGTPVLVWASPHSNILWESHLQQGDNRVRAKLATSAVEYNVTDRIRWIFLWTNPVDAYAVVNAASLLTLNGFLRCDADGSGPGSWIDIGNGLSNVSASVTLSQWHYWTDHPGPMQLTSEGMGGVDAHGGFFDDSETRTVTGFGRGHAELLVIPPLATELFEIDLVLFHTQDDGSVLADFAESGRHATCPYMVIQVLSNP